MNNRNSRGAVAETETITITLPKRFVDKLREIARLICNHDIGQSLAETCGWRLKNLTDLKSEEIIDLIEDKRWPSRSGKRKGESSYCYGAKKLAS